MRSPARFLIPLYPANWRERYGEEFAALLEDSPPTFASAVDLLKGAIKMHFIRPSFPKLALMLSLTGLLAGWGISLLVPNIYTSQATLQITPKLGFDSVPGTTIRGELTERIGQMQTDILSRTSLSQIITDPRLDLYRKERASTPLEDVIEKMRNHDIKITIDSLPGERRSSAFSIAFSYPDRTKAHDTVQTLITRFQEANLTGQRALAQRSSGQTDRLEARIAVLEKRLGIAPSPPDSPAQFARAVDGENLDVLDPPSLPLKPNKPNRAAIASWGFGAGFLMAIVIAVFRRPVRPAIPSPVQPA